MRRSPARVPRVSLLVAGLLAAVSAPAHELPVGDGHVSDHPGVGEVYSCQTQFRGGGARHVGEWFHGDTWDPAAKPHVAGRILWPNASMTMTTQGAVVAVQGNGLPMGQPTGEFPISPQDPAFRYDTNPNAIQAQSLSFAIPRTPVAASSPGCLPMGMIGFTTTGVAIFNALDAAGRDAAAHEVQDLCDGHPEHQGQYHYHSGSPCLPGNDENTLVGWALDGYPILGKRDANDRLLTNADLDACHGRAEAVTADGRKYDYAYRITDEYPYTLGCYHGQVSARTRSDTHVRGNRGGPMRPDRRNGG